MTSTPASPLHCAAPASPLAALAHLTRPAARPLIGMATAVGVLAFVTFGLDQLTTDARIALAVFGLTLVGWVLLDLPETPVALAGALVLVVTEVVSRDLLFTTFGNEIVWLMLAAFVLAAVLRRSGAAERAAALALSRCGTVSGVFWTTAIVIAATAFVIPSTSARAAILLPVFVASAAAIGRPAVTRALALLYPSVILLSAAGSITGAGAHLVAADFMERLGARQIGFLDWAVLALPFALLTSLVACWLILVLFVPAVERRAAAAIAHRPEPIDAPQRLVWAVAGGTILAFSTTALHGLDLALVALIAALTAATRFVSRITFKDALKSVEWNLLLFLAATLVIGEGLLESGAAQFVVNLAVAGLDPGNRPHPALVVTVAAIVSTLAHLVINSRTARATVLVPTLALPLAGFGVDPVALVFLTAIGSGFCQTLLVSAKPVALFATADQATFSQADLLRLAVPLMPIFVVLLVVFALWVWPALGLTL